MPDVPIHTLARITAERGAVHLAELKNGKSVVVHRSKRLAAANAPLVIGDTVLLELTPFDFDSARIIAINPPDGGNPRSNAASG